MAESFECQLLALCLERKEERVAAVVQGEIADILQARGELDEAIRIYLSDVMPIYELLGDKRMLLVGRANVLQMLWQRDHGDDRPHAEQLLQQSLQAAIDMRLPVEISQLFGLAGALEVAPEGLMGGLNLDAEKLNVVKQALEQA